jgi:hypothetical protein
VFFASELFLSKSTLSFVGRLEVSELVSLVVVIILSSSFARVGERNNSRFLLTSVLGGIVNNFL